MKKLFLLILVFGSYIYALEIDECKTDVYFANGILTNEGTASSNALLLKFSIIEKRYKGNIKEYKKHIGKVKEAYNETHFGGLGDLLESLAQKLGVQGHIDDLASFFSPFSSLIQKTSHDRNLETQIASYADSIVHGHKVLVVAHSQGNLFTYEAREKLLFGSKLGWASKYFQVVSIASPAMFAIPGGTPLISWDNDLVAWLGIYNSSMVHNPIRKVDWQRLSPAIGLGTTAQKPTSNYINDSQVGTVYKKDWKAYEGILSKFDSVVHAFTFYMGEDLAGGTILNPFDGSKLHTDKAKTLIMNAVDEKLTYLENLDSQWETDQEFDKNTCNYRITVKHRYYSSLEIGEKVYPFNGSKKLYQVNGEYVKASCGGENILETWDGKKDNECLMIDNEEKEKIEIKQQRKWLHCHAYFGHYAFIHYGESNIEDSISCFVSGAKFFVSPVTLPSVYNEFKGVTFDDYYRDSNYLNEHGIIRYPNEFDKAFETFHQVAFELGMKRLEEYKKSIYKTIKRFPNTGKIISESQTAIGHSQRLIESKKSKIPCAPFALKRRDDEGCLFSIDVEILDN